MSVDRLKYEVCERLWRLWHSRLRRMFDRLSGNETFWVKSRPSWHLCCNGDAGGWRTDLCSWLEEIFRNTDYYCRPQEQDDDLA